MKRAILAGALLVPAIAAADEFSVFSNVCTEIGFKPKTEAHGDCVLELRRRELSKKQQTSRPSEALEMPQKVKIPGDGSPDDNTCQKFGIFPGSDAYGQCRIQLKTAAENAQRQQALYEQQQQAYEQQLAAYEEEKKRREKAKALKQLELGLRLLAGQPPADAAMATAGMMPIAPQRPSVETYTITTPRGMTNCTYVSSARVMNCF